MNRTKSSIKNLIFAGAGQFAGIIINLVSRFVFVRILTQEYLGLDGLFSNIISVLSLVELGIGPAMIFSLYKPLAENNIEKIKALMKLYKKAYTIIGIVVLMLGIAITPFIPYLIDEMPNINENINIIYILFVINTSISYFYSYKRSLIISDQKRYIATFYRYAFYAILNIIQIIVLVITRNYLLFLTAQIIMTLLENICISKKADKLYPYIKDKNVKKLEKNEKELIKKNVFAMIFHRIGTVIVNSTDNLIISKFVGLTAVGIYSNYSLVIKALNTIIEQVFTSITASLGNLGAIETEEKVYKVYKKVFFMNFWIYSFASITLYILFNDFIEIWLGESYLLEKVIVGIIVINFYITGMRKTCLTFKDALGLYWQDRYKPILESIINIIMSITLVQKMGIAGVFLGTLISTLTTCFWIEPYVVYKYGLKQNLRKYFSKYLKYMSLGIVAFFMTIVITKGMFNHISVFTFIGKLAICLIIPNTIFILIFKGTEEFQYFKNLIIDNVRMKNS